MFAGHQFTGIDYGTQWKFFVTRTAHTIGSWLVKGVVG